MYNTRIYCLSPLAVTLVRDCLSEVNCDGGGKGTDLSSLVLSWTIIFITMGGSIEPGTYWTPICGILNISPLAMQCPNYRNTSDALKTGGEILQMLSDISLSPCWGSPTCYRHPGVECLVSARLLELRGRLRGLNIILNIIKQLGIGCQTRYGIFLAV